MDVQGLRAGYGHPDYVPISIPIAEPSNVWSHVEVLGAQISRALCLRNTNRLKDQTALCFGGEEAEACDSSISGRTISDFQKYIPIKSFRMGRYN